MVERFRSKRVSEDPLEMLYYPDLMRLLHKRKETLREWVRRRILPAPVEMTDQSKGWPRWVIRDWMKERMSAADREAARYHRLTDIEEDETVTEPEEPTDA